MYSLKKKRIEILLGNESENLHVSYALVIKVEREFNNMSVDWLILGLLQ